VLDVKIRTYPCHAANRPWHDPELRATRHAHFVLDGSGPRIRRTKLSDLGASNVAADASSKKSI